MEETTQVTLEDLQPGSIIKLDKPTKETIETNVGHFTGEASEAMFCGRLPAYSARSHCLPNLMTMHNGVFTKLLITSFDRGLQKTFPLDVVKGKREEEVQAMFKKQYAKKYPSPLAVGMQIGSDPEIFVMGGNGRVLPAWEFLGTKSSAAKRYWDGAQAEWRSTVATCLVEYTRHMQPEIARIIFDARVKDKHAVYTNMNVVPLGEDILSKSALKYLEFGCAPSINVYDDMGEPPMDPRMLPVRFAGGHIHAGIGEQKYNGTVREMVYALDGILGVACVGMAANIDDPVRRRFYGRAGEIRLPRHGLEYRVLSNFWLISPSVEYVVHELFRSALKFGATGAYSLLFKTPQDEVRRIINECDVKAARECVKKHEKLFEHMIAYSNIVGSKSRATKWLLKAIYKGVECVVPTMSIEQNWSEKSVIEILKAGYAKDKDYEGYTFGGSAGQLTWEIMTKFLETKRVQAVAA